jgi:hypothetical protein
VYDAISMGLGMSMVMDMAVSGGLGRASTAVGGVWRSWNVDTVVAIVSRNRMPLLGLCLVGWEIIGRCWRCSVC